MISRTKIAAAALLAGAIAISGCAKKHHISTYVPPAPATNGPQFGIASWYGHPYHGRPAADGEIYDMEKLTAAHRTLPFNTWVRVTNLANNKTVDVRIIDRGPFIDGRIIDLSHAAAQAIDLIGPGVVQVRVDIIAAPAAAAPALYSIQIGAFTNHDRAEQLRGLMESQFGVARIVLRRGPPDLWRVLVGSAATLDDANALADRVRQAAGDALVVRMDSISAISGGTQE